ncbi:MAG: pyrimidine-nucleoside phosphorylase [Heliobacteriaceae bacterium]|nr:pyrimidine-nucleoside phosphorylase [Heliobacteriaceae bacterium]
MQAYDIIAKKRNGYSLTPEEIRFFVDGYVNGNIPDYQVAAWCMAVYFRGMTAAETTALTYAMVASGDTVDLSPIPGIKVDKHSTGGVGDTTTLILAPLVAAMDIPMAKMSGRGLGHTGGTLDKLESIPGFQVDLSRRQFIHQVKTLGLAIAGQTTDIVPADKKLYALRDVTATVEAMPLIASSVMSKKIAAGADAILLDVKVGTGAFMHTRDQAIALAETMVAIGRQLGRRTVALLTAMDQPLGNAVGNALEVIEAIAVLRGEKLINGVPVSVDLREITLELAGRLAFLAGKTETVVAGRSLAEKSLVSGAAAERFARFVSAQGGDDQVLTAPETILPQACYRKTVPASIDGWVCRLDAWAIGRAAAMLGAGRTKKEDMIDYAAGVLLYKRVGERVTAGEPLAELHYNTAGMVTQAQTLIAQAFTIEQAKPGQKQSLILGEVG